MSLEKALAEVVGSRHVLTDPELTRSYEADWTGRFSGRARAVVRPAGAEQVAGVIAACREEGVPIVPQGGNTGLVGGGTPRGGEVLVSLRRCDAVEDVDPANGQLTAGAGVTLAQVQQAAREAGYEAGLDIGARDSCTVGGVVACDAGGARALRHGTARARVAGLEAVLADGSTVRRLAGLAKDNAGYDLPALLVGCEGTLGLITRVRWRLVPRLDSRVTALVGMEGPAEAVALLGALRANAPTLESCDFFLHESLELVAAHRGLRSPLARPSPLYVLCECAGRTSPLEELAAALEGFGAHDALIADDSPGRARLWAPREGLPEAIVAAGVAHKLDVGIPLPSLERFLDGLDALLVSQAGARSVVFGHLGDGNVHVNLLGLDPHDERLDDAVLELAVRCGGTISAEHGVGVAKARWLERARGEAEVAAMRAIKDALDPDRLLNPGVVLPAPVSAASRG